MEICNTYQYYSEDIGLLAVTKEYINRRYAKSVKFQLALVETHRYVPDVATSEAPAEGGIA